MIKTKPISKFVIDRLAFEIAQQGHKHTGKLIKSLISKVDRIGDGFIINIKSIFYAKFLIKGVRGTKIPYQPGSGKKKIRLHNGTNCVF